MSFTVKNLLLAGVYLVFSIFVSAEMRNGLPFGEVVGFELMFTKNIAEKRVKEWQKAALPSGQTKLATMKKNTRIDFAFIVGYVGLIVYLAKAIAGEGRKEAATTISWLASIAGLCDIVENFQILQILEGNFGLRPMVMSVCAAAKFGLMAVSLGWIAWLCVKRSLMVAQ